MSHGEDASVAHYLQSAANADKVERRWLSQGPRITQDDLKHGSASIERCTAAEWMRAAGVAGVAGIAGSPAAGANHRPNAAKTGAHGTRGNGGAAANAHVMTFGKHRGKPMAVVQDEDPGYFAWAVRDVADFEARARKAGLLDNDPL